MNEEKTLQILESIFGKGTPQGKSGDYLFYCKSCNHHKKKLSVNINKSSSKYQNWACWVCRQSNNTKGRTLYGLLKRFNATSEQIKEMKDALGEQTYTRYKTKEVKQVLSLPKEFVPLWNDTSNSIGKRHTYVELKRRKINSIDIMRYNIGYCETGEYSNRIIIPSYNDKNSLNYFIARAYFSESNLKYKNPKISKNVIVFDNLINWNLPITLCEGVFDAIAIRRNAIPLLGKQMSEQLLEKIITLRPPSIYVALDQDAIRDAIKIVEKISNEQIPVYLMILKDKDPSDIGFEKMIKELDTSILIDETNLFKYKIQYNVI